MSRFLIIPARRRTSIITPFSMLTVWVVVREVLRNAFNVVNRYGISAGHASSEEFIEFGSPSLGQECLLVVAMSRTPLKHIDLWRYLPVSILLSSVIYLATCQLPYAISLIPVLLAVGWLGIQIRLGRFPWFETKDGKKHPVAIWIESKVPFLRADFYRR